jgi:pyruvate,water dikinase
VSITQLFRHWTYQVFAPGALLRSKYNAFKELLAHDEACLELIADLEEIHYNREPADWARVVYLTGLLRERVVLLVARLTDMNPVRHMGLGEYRRKVEFYVQMGVELPAPDVAPPHVLSLDDPSLTPELAGGKAANLARAAAAARGAGAPVPEGFVITANCCQYVMEYNELRDELDERLARVNLAEPEELARLCAEMRALVLRAELPEAVRAGVRAAARALAGEERLLAVRSSAIAEDGEASFAGQYASELGVPADGVERAYLRVLAAKYSAKAVTYRILHGLADLETPMAALVMPLIDARAAGVAYTRVADGPGGAAGNGGGDRAGEPVLAVYSVPGLGTSLVDGRMRPEVHRLTRDDPPRLIELAARLGAGADAPVVEAPLLSSMEAKAVARAAWAMEREFGRPQDVEWAVARDGALHVLQTRTLQSERAASGTVSGPGPGTPPEPPVGARVLLQGAEPASSGVGCGLVVHVDTVMDVGNIDPDAVLVVRTLSPSLARVVRKASAVVAAAGSRASHLASVAREFGLPVLIAGDEVFSALEPDSVVTVDGWRGAVYAGRVAALLDARPRREDRSPLARRLAGVMERVSRLTLTDPGSPDFAPEKWFSLHDVVRYAHEKAVAEMFSLVGRGGRGLRGARRLRSELPIVLYLLDLEGGLFEDAADKDEITPNDIKSLPMWALWWGLSSEDVAWPKDTLHLDWEAFDRVSAGIFDHESSLLASYAVTSENYLHLMVRFGYHFAVVDALCGPDVGANYVNFRFMGGGAGPDGRRLRLCFVRRALEEQGFSASIKGDLLDASLAREHMDHLQRKLAVLGYLLARTRLMDMQLKDEEQLEAEVGAFRAAVARFARGGGG